ncbi:MAG: TonB family protein [Candidatus Zixiibacteriota bacterium]
MIVLKRDIIFALMLHVAAVAALTVSKPFDFRKPLHMDEVIRVTLTGPPPMRPAPQVAVGPAVTAPTIPAAVPITDPKQPKKKPATKPKQATKPPKRVIHEPSAAELAQSTEIEGVGKDSPFAGATISNSSFTYPYWFEQAFIKIQSNWRNPVDADGVIVCVVYFEVIRSGRVAENRVQKSSGITAFDDACLAAVDRSSPFPPLPREFRDEIIGITLPFKYEPR